MSMLVNPFGVSPGGGDPSFGNVVFLSHFDGTNGSTTLTNVVQPLGRGTTISASGTAALTTTSPLFGTASLNIPAGVGNSALTTGSSSDYSLLTTFTIELAFNSSSTTGAIIDMGTGGTTNLRIQRSFTAMAFAWDSASFNISGGSISSNVWTRAAVVVTGGNGYLFIDGVLVAGPTTVGANSLNATQFSLGERLDGTQHNTCKIDELRITKGVARYTSTYTVAAAAFPDS